jgi:hypothetical protein
LLQTPYCPRNLVASEFYISGTEPTRDCDKHLAYGTPGYAPIDTFTTVPPSGGIQQPPVRVTPPTIQPGYEPVPSRNRTPTVFDTTKRTPTVSPDQARRLDSLRRADSLARDSARRRTDLVPAGRPPR